MGSGSDSVCTMYVELEHSLVPGNIQDINEKIKPPDFSKDSWDEEEWKHKRTPRYTVVKKDVMDILADKENKSRINQEQTKAKSMKISQDETKALDEEKNRLGEEAADEKEMEAVVGTTEEVYFDHDFGFFSAVLACYNNHWVLKTSPDDWWNVIVRNVAQAVDDNGEKENVRKFFVEHQGKKMIDIDVPTLAHLDYSWLFDQFAQGIRMNIKTPGYVDVMQADFTTTTKDQLISSQIMLMASVQKYFEYCFGTFCCGIPGVEMVGEVNDWERLVQKTSKLEEMLQPVMKEIGLGEWFSRTLTTLAKLVDTYKGNPDKKWWSHILDWHTAFGSGARSSWSGWMIDFLMAGEAHGPEDFKSGVVSVPVKIYDVLSGPPVEDTGKLVAGTVGYTVKEGGRAPVVEAKQGWVLLLPVGSPITPRIKGNME